MKRRRFLHSAVCLLCSGCVVTSKSTDSALPNEINHPLDTGSNPQVDTADNCEVTGSLTVDLSQYPELRQVNGSAVVNFPDQFVQLVIACVAEEQWSAVWRICSHGACDLEWTPTESQWECPCHGSIFSVDGEVQRGPATEDQAVFDVCRNGDFLEVKRRI